MIPSFDQTKPEPSACEVYARSRPPKNPNGSKNGSTSRRRIVASVWMFTTEGSTLCATTTTGVRRDAPTLAGIGGALSFGSTGCDCATGLQASDRAMIRVRLLVFMRFECSMFNVECSMLNVEC